MRLLIDTHIFIWWNGDSTQLTPQIRALCENKDNSLILSTASIWEMQIKSQLGKISFNQPLSEVIKSQQRANGLEILPITPEHIYAVQNLPLHHKDPFDRIIISQAIIENIILVTVDEAIKRYDVELNG